MLVGLFRPGRGLQSWIASCWFCVNFDFFFRDITQCDFTLSQQAICPFYEQMSRWYLRELNWTWAIYCIFPPFTVWDNGLCFIVICLLLVLQVNLCISFLGVRAVLPSSTSIHIPINNLSNFLKAPLIILTRPFQYRHEGISSKILCCLVMLHSLSYEVHHVYIVYHDIVLNSCSIVARCSDQSRRWNGLVCGLWYCCVCHTPLNIEYIFTHSWSLYNMAFSTSS